MVFAEWFLRRKQSRIKIFTLSNANLVASRSIHQDDCRFSDVSRGRRCAFTCMSLSALFTCANGCRASKWIHERSLLAGYAMDGRHIRSDIDRRGCHVSKSLGKTWKTKPFPMQRYYLRLIYPIKYVCQLV